MHKYIAAILLLPASFVVSGSLSAWLKALRMGKYSFFAKALKTGPLVVRRPRSFLAALFVYYPMQAAIEIMHTGSFTGVLKKSLAIVRLRLRGVENNRGAVEDWRDTRLPFVPLAHITELLRDPAIKIVSFDIFDTLLLRPALSPKDIFCLLARKVNADYGVDFMSMRLDAEEETGLPYASIGQIYDHMARKYKLPPSTARAIMEEEIRCEGKLLSPRPDMKAAYDEAVRQGKRIIAISDMYLSADILREFLQKNGYDAVSEIYVSCERGGRKDEGRLYDMVLQAENAQPSEILHVGDNYHADYEQAIKKHLCAVWYPSVAEMALHNHALRETIHSGVIGHDPLWSLFIGHALNRLYGASERAPDNIAEIKDTRHFAELTLAPLLTDFCIFLATHQGIQSAYRRIYFASRDGWLPSRAYEIVRGFLGGIPGRYFYAGRRAYFPLLYDDFFDFMQSLQRADDVDSYTLRHVMQAYFHESELLENMLQECSAEELSLAFFPNKERCLNILRRFQHKITAFICEKKTRATAYYRATFTEDEPHSVVFDIGYSGSVGRALTRTIGRPVDKIYFWESEENSRADRRFHSTTFLYMKENSCTPYNLLFEELFAPAAGGVVDFDADCAPRFESLTMTAESRHELESMHQACLEYTSSFCELFGDYMPFAGLEHPDSVNLLLKMLLWDSPFCNLSRFKSIVFDDPVYRVRHDSLEKKLEKHFPAGTVFSGTGFENPAHKLEDVPCPGQGIRSIGIHVHLYHIDMTHEIVRYLQDFPAPFDLYLTICDENFALTAQRLFSRAMLPRRQELRVIPSPNRGRDVAPWVLGMRPYQDKYELFCHVHTKKSSHFDFGNAWQRYLFDNLLLPDVVEAVFMLFSQRPRLGCLFPPVFPQLAAFMTARGIPPAGLKEECRLAGDLLRRMRLRDEICRSELLFPVGNMLWYRPHALRQLFTLNLALEEFAAEPIGVEGTLAHAIERLPALIAARNGYDVQTFTHHA